MMIHTKIKMLFPALCLVSCLYYSLATASDTSKVNEKLFEVVRSQKYIESVQYLINTGADINARNNVGNTPLISAALWGNVAAVKALIAAGADTHARNNKGQTALNVAYFWKLEHSKTLPIVGEERTAKHFRRYTQIIDILTTAEATQDEDQDWECEQQRQLIYGHPKFKK